jgi:hypothetical protein
MKKIYPYLQNPNVQGALLVTFIVVAIALVTILTWGK